MKKLLFIILLQPFFVLAQDDLLNELEAGVEVDNTVSSALKV